MAPSHKQQKHCDFDLIWLLPVFEVVEGAAVGAAIDRAAIGAGVGFGVEASVRACLNEGVFDPSKHE